MSISRRRFFCGTSGLILGATLPMVVKAGPPSERRETSECPAGFPPQPAGAGAIYVRVTIARMHCLKPTDNSRDEVYVLVAGRSPQGNIARRLPSDDDYYGWTDNQANYWWNQKEAQQPRPLLGGFWLAQGQSAQLAISLADQDNKAFNVVTRIAEGVAALALVAGEVDAAVVMEALAGVLSQFGDKEDDHLGAFTVSVLNDGGKLAVTWRGGNHARYLPGDGSARIVGPGAGFFECRSSKGKYNLIANVTVASPEQLGALSRAEMAEDAPNHPQLRAVPPVPMHIRVGRGR